mmetsp:Transcript_68735/g.151384  ORF Transcript_68735/g.151384 Transcript_68735/m.151384 type:complete len:121 (-) Transcript_68735:1211-1573(-)
MVVLLLLIGPSALRAAVTSEKREALLMSRLMQEFLLLQEQPMLLKLQTVFLKTCPSRIKLMCCAAALIQRPLSVAGNPPPGALEVQKLQGPRLCDLPEWWGMVFRSAPSESWAFPRLPLV